MTRATIEAYYAAFNRGDMEGMLATLHDDFAHHVNEGATRLGKTAFADFCRHMSESYRELVTELTNTYMSVLGNRTNDVMRVLTVVTTVFIPLTFIVGIYGMNFDHMPELHSPWGYPLTLFAMAVLAVGMLVYFRRRGWLGVPRE